jgi:hypothetical protein
MGRIGPASSTVKTGHRSVYSGGDFVFLGVISWGDWVYSAGDFVFLSGDWFSAD